MNITQKELAKLNKNPLPELRKRFNAILSEYKNSESEGKITKNTIRPDHVCWNNSHAITGTLSTQNYTMTINISKRI